MSVVFEELSSMPSPEVTCTHSVFEAVRRFKISWSDTVAFYKELMGYYTPSGGGVVTYTPPAYFPGVPECLCRSVSFVPFPPDRIATATNGTLTGVTATTNQPEYAFVTAKYSTKADQASLSGSPSVPAGSNAHVTYDIGASMQAIPNKRLFYNTGAGVDKIVSDGSYAVQIPTDNFTVKWSRVPAPSVPWSAINATRGKLNNATFNNYPPEFVLFSGASLDYEYQFTGSALVVVNYKFSAKQVNKLSTGMAKSGWTHQFIPELGDYAEVTNAQSEKLYKTANFNSLFVFA